MEQRGAGWVGVDPRRVTYLASFISICCRISCRSWSLRTGKMLRSSSSCLLGRFRSFTASSSFLILRGSVPVRVEQRSASARTESFDTVELATGRKRRKQIPHFGGRKYCFMQFSKGLPKHSGKANMINITQANETIPINKRSSERDIRDTHGDQSGW